MPDAASIHVMIVDDQTSIRAILRNSLAQLGIINVSERKNGKDALEYLSQNSVNLIISDFNMPEMNGLELLKAVRANPRMAKTAFIILTGEASKELVQEAVKAGVNNFLAKPYTVGKLKAVMEAVFGTIV
ncbi:response regulator receiver protein [Acetobacter aceti NRIC 0242]|uniref:Response regulator n=1 Tax=Acetobacter aceti NBRC 14818 TaxID=887700 RepID=A0AB33IIN3_ACEAC|nr:response regulator [Acetobacter aceti]TCS32661.1 two-component system chemotaxis response regulator CheY [Acetobacter aceti NBRC 14818]BCK77444.1 response regulator [Acetobacter aceti NBRC 14818]GAN57796.1 response regulator receiver chemotaxis protein cheY [Acetobacter aceti NBRC 14818]GBO82519.1 response regulator receiver protein [Acetobacter aceti NRIC 0242]